jgi:hypothetical protein
MRYYQLLLLLPLVQVAPMRSQRPLGQEHRR